MVQTEQTFIHTNEDDETEVICMVHASPKAEVVWFKNGEPVSKDQGIFSHHGSRHSIILPAFKESIFGVYKCKATNKFGSDEKTTEVSGEWDILILKKNLTTNLPLLKLLKDRKI